MKRRQTDLPFCLSWTLATELRCRVAQRVESRALVEGGLHGGCISPGLR